MERFRFVFSFIKPRYVVLLFLVVLALLPLFFFGYIVFVNNNVVENVSWSNKKSGPMFREPLPLEKRSGRIVSFEYFQDFVRKNNLTIYTYVYSSRLQVFCCMAV